MFDEIVDHDPPTTRPSSEYDVGVYDDVKDHDKSTKPEPTALMNATPPR